MLSVAHARKFVLDDAMSSYLAEVSHGFWSGGLRKRNHALDNAQQMARLPHPLTWIELNYATAYFLRSKAIGAVRVMDKNGIEPASYWLAGAPASASRDRLHREPDAEKRIVGWLGVSPSCQCAVAQRRRPADVANDALFGKAAWVRGRGRHGGLLLQPRRMGSDVWHGVVRDHAHNGAARLVEADIAGYVMHRIPVRDLWAFLATINDLPVRIENVEPSRGYMARGSYKKFLKHSVVRLTVPETRWRSLVAKSAIMLRKRAHQVRGHWRKDGGIRCRRCASTSTTQGDLPQLSGPTGLGPRASSAVTPVSASSRMTMRFITSNPNQSARIKKPPPATKHERLSYLLGAYGDGLLTEELFWGCGIESERLHAGRHRCVVRGALQARGGQGMTTMRQREEWKTQLGEVIQAIKDMKPTLQQSNIELFRELKWQRRQLQIKLSHSKALMARKEMPFSVAFFQAAKRLLPTPIFRELHLATRDFRDLEEDTEVEAMLLERREYVEEAVRGVRY